MCSEVIALVLLTIKYVRFVETDRENWLPNSTVLLVGLLYVSDFLMGTDCSIHFWIVSKLT